MEFEPTTDETKQETMELEMTPVCIDIKRKAKKAAARSASSMCPKLSKTHHPKTYFSHNTTIQTTNFFKSQMLLAS